MALTPEDLAILRYQAQAANVPVNIPYDPRSGNTPDFKAPTPYDPRSGNTPDAKVLTEADLSGMRYQGQYTPPVPYDPRSGNISDAPPFRPVAVVVTQNGERIQIDASGKALDGTTPVGSTKALPSTTVFTPVATIITQNGEEIQVDSTGRAADGSVPVGTTKPGSAVSGTGAGAGAGAGGVGGTQGAAGGEISPERQSAYDILYSEFSKYGLGSLVEDIKYLLQSNVSPSQFAIELQNTKAYQNRFAANKERIAKGLAALSPAEYIGLEDQYQNIMRNYGLPESYYAKDATGKQAGFEKFLAGDVSAVELEDRISTAQNRVLNSNPEVLASLKSFYPDITNADVLAYTLDPKNALENIKRKVTAAEIGGAALQAGLTSGMSRAEELAAAGISKAQAQQGFQSVAAVAPRGTQLAEIYGQQPYGQTQAEQEVFGLAGSTEARKQREKLAGLEKAAFSASAGTSQGALGRERAGGI